MDPELIKKKLEYEEKKARAKALQLRLTCTICGVKPRTLLNCPCGTTQYCSTECQRIDWRDRGHRKACKKIRNERAAEAARAEAPMPPKEVVYGPAPRSHADDVRARITAEHEAARLRREANPEPEPESARFGSRCPICMEEWDVNDESLKLLTCCCRQICGSCARNIIDVPCPLCRLPHSNGPAESLARIRRHVENEVPEAVKHLGDAYSRGSYGLVKSQKKMAKIYKRAVELGSLDAMSELARCYRDGNGVKQDRSKCVRLFRVAADRGVATAQFNLAHELIMGDDESDKRESCSEGFRYCRRAAEQKLTSAEAYLGVLYASGVCKLASVQPDIDEAKRWLTRAAAKGNRDAICQLRSLDEFGTLTHPA